MEVKFFLCQAQLSDSSWNMGQGSWGVLSLTVQTGHGQSPTQGLGSMFHALNVPQDVLWFDCGACFCNGFLSHDLDAGSVS